MERVHCCILSISRDGTSQSNAEKVHICFQLLKIQILKMLMFVMEFGLISN